MKLERTLSLVRLGSADLHGPPIETGSSTRLRRGTSILVCPGTARFLAGTGSVILVSQHPSVRFRTDEPRRVSILPVTRLPSPTLSVLLSHNIDGMVVVASGNLVRVKGWSGVLRTAAIQFAVVDCQFEDPFAPVDRAEIWVENEDIEEARTALLKPNSDESLIC